MILVASCQISEKLKRSLNFKILSLKPYKKLDIPVSSHPDMLICVIDDYVFCYEDYYYENLNFFNEIERIGYTVIKSKHVCAKEYPNDIGLNVLKIGKKIFCNKQFTAKEIVEYGENNGYKIIDVKQGYSACSTFVVDENNVITSDFGMKNALEKDNINVVMVPNSKIILEGYNCGFVGGSGFVLDNIAYYFGQVDGDNNYYKIIELLDKLKIKIINVTDGSLHDYGGVKILKRLS